MEWLYTFMIFAVGAVMLGLGRMLERPRDSFRVPLVPPVLLMFLGGVLIIMAGSHLLTMLGIVHGRIKP